MLNTNTSGKLCQAKNISSLDKLCEGMLCYKQDFRKFLKFMSTKTFRLCGVFLFVETF